MSNSIDHNSAQVSDYETENHVEVDVSLKEQIRKTVMEIMMEMNDKHTSEEEKDYEEKDDEN